MIVNRKVLTLDEFTIQQLRSIPKATGELSSLLRDIGLAAKRVNVEVNKAGLVDILGDAGTINVQGEDVKKLDVYANNQFLGVLQHGISSAGMGSEELADIVEVAYGLAEFIGSSPEQLEHEREKKSTKRGNFSQGIILEEA